MAASAGVRCGSLRYLIVFILLRVIVLQCKVNEANNNIFEEALMTGYPVEGMFVSCNCAISSSTLCCNALLYNNRPAWTFTPARPLTRTKARSAWRRRGGLTRYARLPVSGGCVGALLLALAGDVQLNPGPRRNHPQPRSSGAPSMNNSVDATNISLFYMNARSMADYKLSQFNNYFSDNGEFDVVCATETWLNSGVYDGEVLDDSQYSVYRRDRGQTGEDVRKGGGVLIAVSSKLKSRRREDLESAACEVVWSEIQLDQKSRLFIGCVYTAKPSEDLIEALRDSLHEVNSKSKPGDTILLCGDFNMPNIHWTHADEREGDNQLKSSTVATPTLLDTAFLSLVNEYDLNQYVSFPTRANNFLDLLFTNNPDVSTSVTRVPPAVKSDHEPFHCNLSVPSLITAKSPKISTRFNWRKADYQKICSALSNSPWTRLYENTNVNEKCNIFYEIVNKVISECVPVLKVNPIKYPAWYDNETINALNDKNRAYRQWKRNDTADSKIEFQVKRTYFKTLKKLKYKHYMSKVDTSLGKEPSLLWNYVRKKTRSVRIPTEVHYNVHKAHDGDTCCQLFSNYFKTKFTPTLNNNEPLPAVPTFTDECISSITVSRMEIETLLQSLTIGKSSGPDEIPVAVLKYCRRVISKPLTDIFNHALKSGVFPTRWKCANITPVLKKGSRFNVKNYRPISLLSVISKVFESLIHKRLYCHVSKCLSSEQHGFVKRRSTVTNLTEYTQYIASKMDSKIQVDSIYTDFSSAFDSVDHKLLLHKLSGYGICGSLHSLLTSYLSDRSQSVTINSAKSSSVHVTSGVPQGSILGPLLFVLYVNDIPSCFKYSKSLMYADDLKIFRPILKRSDCDLLQKDISSLSDWCKVWKLDLNISKCNIITFTNKKKYLCHVYKLNDSNLERVNEIRDLGVIISSSLSFNSHVNHIVPKAFKLLGFIKRNCMREFQSSTLRRMFVSLVRPQVDYATVIWNPNFSHETNTNRVESVQRRLMKLMCLKSNYAYHRVDYHNFCLDINLPSLKTRRQNTDLIFLYKIIHNYYDCNLLPDINFRVPGKFTRSQDVFMVPRSRINVHKFSCLNRLQYTYNTVVGQDVDIHNLSLIDFKRQVCNLSNVSP